MKNNLRKHGLGAGEDYRIICHFKSTYTVISLYAHEAIDFLRQHEYWSTLPRPYVCLPLVSIVDVDSHGHTPRRNFAILVTLSVFSLEFSGMIS